MQHVQIFMQNINIKGLILSNILVLIYRIKIYKLIF